MDGKTLYNYAVKAMGGIADEDKKFFMIVSMPRPWILCVRPGS